MVMALLAIFLYFRIDYFNETMHRVFYFYLKPQQNTPTSTGGEINAGICLYFL